MRARVLGEVAGLSERQGEWKPGPGEWSVGEVLDHLVKAEGIGGKLISVTLKRAEERGALLPYPGEVEEFPWTPPTPDDRWMVQVPEPAAPTSSQPIEGLRKAMTEQAHPILGEMNLAQWCRFAAFHMRVHLRQLQEVKRAAGFPGMHA